MRLYRLLVPICSISTLVVCQLASQSEQVNEEEWAADHLNDLNDGRFQIQHDTFDVAEDGQEYHAIPGGDARVQHTLPQHEQQEEGNGEAEDVAIIYSIDELETEGLLVQTRATLIKQQVKRVGLGVDQLKQILLELQEEEDEVKRTVNGFTGFEAADADDDRTLLDVFGEVAKEYLTKKVIPDTDPECRWDWHSLRCESACDCEFRFKPGDYHLGRACRQRRIPIRHCDESNLEPVVNKRLVSLIHQTAQLIGDNVKNVLKKTSEPVCRDLVRLHTVLNGRCMPRGRIPTKSIPQRLLCGSISFVECPEDDAMDHFMHRPYVRQ
ncbi:hypothetical protein MPSEU_000886300 [Mayamaea pseudoterrestris]|nr:hypothetical protein MPSEU_000886300 [Mayamaea pseudoterrestris]